MRFEDKVVIVTGGASGMGRLAAYRIAEEGARVVVADIQIEAADEVIDEIKALGHEAVAVKVDVANFDDARQMAKVALDTFGQIDILLNVAGGSVGPVIKTKQGLFAESTPERWHEMITLNLTGTLACTRAVINHMIERRYGKIVCFSSDAGVIGMQRGTVYSAAKGGVILFSKALAKEIAQYGININTVSPGVIATERLAMIGQDRIEWNKQGIWLDRLGKPEDVINAVLFLASEEANYITGHNIPVDGGLHLGTKNY
jgi:NAD(P)-dependent dehydrogenase (short-subunit alcohol dehydrogenase family)